MTILLRDFDVLLGVYEILYTVYYVFNGQASYNFKAFEFRNLHLVLILLLNNISVKNNLPGAPIYGPIIHKTWTNIFESHRMLYLISVDDFCNQPEEMAGKNLKTE